MSTVALAQDLGIESTSELKQDLSAHLAQAGELRVDASQALRTKVQLHFMNQETSPAGKTGGVVVMHELTEVEISCLPKDLPEFIEIDLSNLAVGDIIHLSELKLPAGVEIPEL